MTNIIAFTHRAGKIDQERAKQWLSLISKTSNSGEVYNIPQHRPEDIIGNQRVVVSFGRVVSTIIDQLLDEKGFSIYHVRLPSLKQLTPLQQNKEPRQQAKEQLAQASEVLQETLLEPEVLLVTEQDLPDLNARQILLLQKLMEDNGQTHCFQTTKNGKLIEIRTAHNEGSKADIQVTFEELYTARLVLDVLGTTEVSIVHTQSAKKPSDRLR
jgi:hypothetical protein